MPQHPGRHLRLVDSTKDDWNAQRLLWRQSKGGALDDPFDADLSGADLRGVDLSGFDLTDLNLEGANLTEARLSGADLSRSNLRGARLDGAVLVGATFCLCDLARATFAGAQLGDTKLLRVDLSDVEGLATTEHRFTSYVDTGTLSLTFREPVTELSRRDSICQFLARAGVASQFLLNCDRVS